MTLAGGQGNANPASPRKFQKAGKGSRTGGTRRNGHEPVESAERVQRATGMASASTPIDMQASSGNRRPPRPFHPPPADTLRAKRVQVGRLSQAGQPFSGKIPLAREKRPGRDRVARAVRSAPRATHRAGTHATAERHATRRGATHGARRTHRTRQPESHRRGFRGPVRAAHRAPRARFAGVFRDRAVRRHRRGSARASAGGHHPVGRAGERLRRGRAVPRPRHLRAGHPNARASATGSRSWPSRWAAPWATPTWASTVRPRCGAATGAPRLAVRQHAGRADRVDEPPRRRGRGAGRLRGDGLHRRVPRGVDGMRRAAAVRDAVPPRGAAHRMRRRAAGKLPVRHLRA